MSPLASNGKTVLISGINGYIASNIGLDLLRKGYTVRGTSRSTSTKDDLLAGAFKGFESRYVRTLCNLLRHLRFQELMKSLLEIHRYLHPSLIPYQCYLIRICCCLSRIF